jgi:hypothetical protein
MLFQSGGYVQMPLARPATPRVKLSLGVGCLGYFARNGQVFVCRVLSLQQFGLVCTSGTTICMSYAIASF